MLLVLTDLLEKCAINCTANGLFVAELLEENTFLLCTLLI